MSLLALLAIGQGLLTPLDRSIYDIFLKSFEHAPDGRVVVVEIDEASIDRFGKWPWPRARVAQVIDAVRAHGARRVGVDILFADATDASNDQALAHSLAKKRDVVLPLLIESLQQGGQLLEILPKREFIDGALALGHVHYEADDDGVVRGLYLWQGIGGARWPHFALAMASPNAQANRAWLNGDSTANVRVEARLIPFVGPAGTMPTYSVTALLDGALPANALADRDVLVGVNLVASNDSVPTPATRDARPMSGVEFNANVLTAIHEAHLIEAVGVKPTLIFTLFTTVLPFLLFYYLPARYGLFVSAGLGLLALLISLIALRGAMLWLPPATAVAAALASFPLWGWRRLEQAVSSLRDSLNATRSSLSNIPIQADEPALDQELAFTAKLLKVRIERSAPNKGLSTSPLATADGTYFVKSDHPLSAAESAFLARLSQRRPPPAPDQPYEQLSRQLTELRFTTTRLSALFEVAHGGLAELRDGVVLLGLFGQVLFANAAARSLVSGEFSMDALQGALATEPDNLFADALHACFVARQARDFSARSADGREWLLHVTPENDEHLDRAGVAILLVDITNLRRAERNRRETMSFLSHDLRSPIVSLLALTRRFRSEHSNAPDIQDLLNRLEVYAQRSLRNAEQFLQLTRVENEPTMQRYDLDLGGVAENAIAEVQERATAKGIEIHLHDSEEPAFVAGNGEFLERALMNLLDNAIKYCPAGSRIVVEIQHVDDEVRCAVIDNGPGIELPEADKLVRAYYRGKQHSEHTEGMGIGLRFVELTAQRHDGRLTIANNLDGGACFTLWLPRADD